ncbi:hypothetical protein DRJ17_01420 [Candidatus Woesearchaeota archaeon]|nr:MAG: hypothetical protein DRJ17_01420 [Candidatus Woesearchaeota archaeon]
MEGTLTERLNTLFESHLGPNFFPDGVIDEERFLSANPKILYLLKDVNALETEQWDLRDAGRYFARKLKEKGASYPTITKMATISHYILEGFPDYASEQWIPGEDLAESLLSIAIVNLKKTAGKSSTSDEKIKPHAEKNFKMWKSEIDIIQPDIALCGGTYYLVKDLFIKNGVIKESDLEVTPNGMHFFRYNNSALVDVPHPNARYPYSHVYSYIKLGLNHILSKSKNKKYKVCY